MTNILTFVHSNYLVHNAGVEKVVSEQQNIFRYKKYTSVVICPISRNKKILGQNIPLPTKQYIIIKNGVEEKQCDFAELKRFIFSIKWKAIIIHHLKNYNHNQKLFEMLDLLSKNAPMFFYIHDYATICFNHVLMKNGRYCSNKKTGLNFSKCWKCKFYLFGIIEQEFYRKLFCNIKIKKIIFPSQVVFNIWHTVYQEVDAQKCLIIPHQKFSKELTLNNYHNHNKMRIAYVGYAAPEKGWGFFKDIIRKNSVSSNYDLFILGHCKEKIPNVIQQEVSFLQDGNDAMVKKLKENQIDIAFLWSKRPETYSYTFFESYIAGTYIISSKESGNIAYMIEKLRCGKVFENENECLKWLENKDKVNRTLIKYFKCNTTRPAKLVPNDRFLKLIGDA